MNDYANYQQYLKQGGSSAGDFSKYMQQYAGDYQKYLQGQASQGRKFTMGFDDFGWWLLDGFSWSKTPNSSKLQLLLLEILRDGLLFSPGCGQHHRYILEASLHDAKISDPYPNVEPKQSRDEKTKQHALSAVLLILVVMWKVVQKHNLQVVEAITRSTWTSSRT